MGSTGSTKTMGSADDAFRYGRDETGVWWERMVWIEEGARMVVFFCRTRGWVGGGFCFVLSQGGVAAEREDDSAGREHLTRSHLGCTDERGLLWRVRKGSRRNSGGRWRWRSKIIRGERRGCLFFLGRWAIIGNAARPRVGEREQDGREVGLFLRDDIVLAGAGIEGSSLGRG